MAKRTGKKPTSKNSKPKGPTSAAELHEAARVLRRSGGDAAQVRELLDAAALAERAEGA